MSTSDDVQKKGRRNALIVSLVLFALAAAVGFGVLWLASQQEADRVRAEVSSTGSHHALLLHGALSRTVAVTEAAATVITSGADPAVHFEKATQRLASKIGGVRCAQWLEGAHVKVAWPGHGCASLLGDPKQLLLTPGSGEAALSGPFQLPKKGMGMVMVGRARSDNPQRPGTVIAMLPAADIVAEAGLHDLPGKGMTWAVVAPLRDNAILSASTHQPDSSGPVAEIPIQVGGVMLVLRVGSASAGQPLVGWGGAIVFLVALLLARLAHGFVAESANFRAERRMRLRLEEKIAQASARAKDADEQRLRTKAADRITGLPDARYLSKYLDKRWLDLVTKNQPIGLMLIELDRFDLLFETAGPQRSEAALKDVSNVVRQLIEDEDKELAVRFRGTAFAVFFAGVNGDPAKRAELARAAVAKLQIPNPRSPVATILTASVGVVWGVPRRNDLMREFANAAENAVRDARAKGQNCVVVRPWPAEKAA